MKHELLLSEAIVQGAKTKKQIRYTFDDGQGGACVTRMAHIGGCDILERVAADAHRKLYFGEKDSFISTDHWAWRVSVPIREVCGCDRPWEAGPEELAVAPLMAHLNDVHEWTPVKIAAWVATLEKKLGRGRPEEMPATSNQLQAVFA